jgi:hypothetical protein
MPPQGIVQVISIEKVKLPPNMTGLAYVKTSLCNEGLLALNIGIIDPGYEGRISSFLVNFSSKPRLLIRGEPFIRLQFMPMDDPATPVDNEDDATYILKRRREAVNFSSTFLNLGAVIESITKDLFAKWRIQILTLAGSIALVLTVMTFLLNWGSLYLVRIWLQPADAVRAEVLRSAFERQTEALVKANDELRARLDLLEGQLKSRPSGPLHQ